MAYQGGSNKRQRPVIPANPNLVPGPCPKCHSPLETKTSQKTGKDYLKCPNQECGEWGGNPTPPPPQTPNRWTSGQSFATSSTTNSTTSSQDMIDIKQSLSIMGNRMNDITKKLDDLDEGIFNFIKAELGLVHTKLEEISSRLDILQKDVGVSKEGATTHQSRLLKKKDKD